MGWFYRRAGSTKGVIKLMSWTQKSTQWLGGPETPVEALIVTVAFVQRKSVSKNYLWDFCGLFYQQQCPSSFSCLLLKCDKNWKITESKSQLSKLFSWFFGYFPVCIHLQGKQGQWRGRRLNNAELNHNFNRYHKLSESLAGNSLTYSDVRGTELSFPMPSLTQISAEWRIYSNNIRTISTPLTETFYTILKHADKPQLLWDLLIPVWIKWRLHMSLALCHYIPYKIFVICVIG